MKKFLFIFIVIGLFVYSAFADRYYLYTGTATDENSTLTFVTDVDTDTYIVQVIGYNSSTNATETLTNGTMAVQVDIGSGVYVTNATIDMTAPIMIFMQPAGYAGLKFNPTGLAGTNSSASYTYKAYVHAGRSGVK